MKKMFLLVMFTALFSGVSQSVMAQKKGDYRQSQSRMLEPQQEVFVRPLVVELNVMSDTRQKATWPFPDADVSSMTVGDLKNLKANSLYLTAQKFDADVIVAATFDIRTVKKGIEITVVGFPARYVNWKVAEKEEDYKWIKEIYGTKFRYKNVNSTQALEDNQAKNSDSK